MPADLIFLNGPVVTVDDARPRAEAVAVLGNRIVRVGDAASVRAEAGPATRVVDLGGRALLPAFNDNHTHPISFGQALAGINAKPGAIATLRGLQDAFRAAASRPENGDGAWLIARGYDDTRLDIGRHPTRWELDEATGGRPALLVRTCGHLGVANSAALALAGVTAATADPDGGLFDRDAHGEPTGVLRETALEVVRANVPEPDEDAIAAALEAAGRRFLADGVTSATEAGIRDPREMAAYQRLWRAGRLPLRTYLMMMLDETMESLLALGVRTGFGDDRLRIGPVKLFADGSIGGRTARMRRPYEGQPDNVGLWMLPPEELKAKVRRAHEAGFQVGIHAIGDAAVELVVDAYA